MAVKRQGAICAECRAPGRARCKELEAYRTAMARPAPGLSAERGYAFGRVLAEGGRKSRENWARTFGRVLPAAPPVEGKYITLPMGARSIRYGMVSERDLIHAALYNVFLSRWRLAPRPYVLPPASSRRV